MTSALTRVSGLAKKERGSMRFLFGSTDERAARERLLARADEALGLVASELARGRTLTRKVHDALGAIGVPLAVEVLEERDGSRTVVLSSRGSRPLVEAIVARAPTQPGLRFSAHRPPRGFEETLATVRGAHGYELERARARAGFSRGHLLDVVVYVPGFSGGRDPRASAAAHDAARCLLGERLLDDWIGTIDAEPAPRAGPLQVLNTDAAPTFPLAELPAAISRAVEGLRAGLPELPAGGIARDGWVLFETEPEAATDHAAQDDVALASSALPEMLKCFLEGMPFSSVRFTRGAERFAYLKIDANHMPFEQRIAERTRLEDALAARLGSRALGAVVGNGLGLRYLYVDLALVSAAAEPVEAVCEVARELGAAERSWLLFCDGDLAGEWQGVWPGSPPPPGG
jgi:hypothetical protein